MPELTYEEFLAMPLTYTMGVRFDNGAQRMYRNEELGVQKETITPYSERTGKWGTSKVGMFLDRDPREFTNSAELYVAWMHRVCGVTEPVVSV